jgi:hypothetical protein
MAFQLTSPCRHQTVDPIGRDIFPIRSFEDYNPKAAKAVCDAWGEYAGYIAEAQSGTGPKQKPEAVEVTIATGLGGVPMIPAASIGRRGIEELLMQKAIIRKFLNMHYGMYIIHC